MSHHVLIFVSFLFLASCSHFKPKSHWIAVKCGHLFDSKHGLWLKNQTLLIKDNKIVEMNPDRIPLQADVIDYSSSYVLPGLIDVHTHLFLEDPTFGKDFSKGLLEFVRHHTDTERRALGVKRQLSLLKSGFVAVRDLGNSGQLSADEMQDPNGVMVITSGPGFSQKLGQFAPKTSEIIIAKEYSLLTKLPPQDFDKAQLVKLYAEDDASGEVVDSQVLKLWVQRAHENGLKVAVHAYSEQAIQAAILSGADTLEHGVSLTLKQLEMMRNQGMTYVPASADILFETSELSKFRSKLTSSIWKQTCQNIKEAKQMGVKLAFGSDYYYSLEKYGLSFGEATLEILLAYEKCAMNSVEILQAATIGAAEVLGKNSTLGVLAPGYESHFLVFKNDPLLDLSELKTPSAIYKNGMLVK